MKTQSIDIMGPEYVLMLGVWWGVAVFLTIVFLAAKRAIVNRRQRHLDARDSLASASGRVDV